MPPNPIVAIRMRLLGETFWSAPASPAAASMAGPVWRKCLLVDIADPFYRRAHSLGGTRFVAVHQGPVIADMADLRGQERQAAQRGASRDRRLAGGDHAGHDLYPGTTRGDGSLSSLAPADC